MEKFRKLPKPLHHHIVRRERETFVYADARIDLYKTGNDYWWTGRITVGALSRELPDKAEKFRLVHYAATMLEQLRARVAKLPLDTAP